MPMKSPFPINGTGSGDGRWLVQQKVAKHAAARLLARSDVHTKGRGVGTTAPPVRKAS